MRRRDILLQAVALPFAVALGGTARAEESSPFDGATVRNLARDLAQRAYQAPDATLPDPLKNLEYQDYRTIRFDAGHALWHGQGLRFTAEFFHRGFLYKEPVKIFEVANGRAELIRYSPDLFTFGKLKPPTGDIGFAGFRLHHPLNRPDYFDEVCAFLGASYFRAVAKGQGYGLSARGLAIKTADPQARSSRCSAPSGWSGRARAATPSWSMRCSTARARRRPSASPSAPASTTVFDIEMALYPRADLAAVGIAPLTSMFLFDANDRARVDDYRAAVHDFDRPAAVDRRGEQLWRPLANPQALQISAFADSGPRGFGLMQREPRFRRLPGSGGALREPAERSGSSRSATGAKAWSRWSRSRPTARSTTTSSPSGGRTIPEGARASTP